MFETTKFVSTVLDVVEFVCVRPNTAETKHQPPTLFDVSRRQTYLRTVNSDTPGTAFRKLLEGLGRGGGELLGLKTPPLVRSKVKR